MSDPSKNFLERCQYRVNQFRSVLWSVVDEELLACYLKKIPPGWRKYVLKLRPSEKAHVVGLCSAVSGLEGVSEDERAELMTLALVHDIGKTITRPSLLMRITRVLLPMHNISHPVLGARILRRNGAPRKLLRRVAGHHLEPGDDKLLGLFQRLDDNC